MKYLYLTLLLLTLFNPIYPFDELWVKAQSFASNSWNLVPAKITNTAEITPVSGAGSTVVQIQILQNTLNSNRNIDSVIVSQKLFKDGQELNPDDANTDNNSSTLSTVEKMILNDNHFERDLNPARFGVFHETDSRCISVEKLNETREINGVLCQSFYIKFSPPRRRDRVEGAAWLNAETGQPVFMDTMPQYPPMMIRNMNIKQYFVYDSENDLFYREKAVSSMTITMMGLRRNLTFTIMDENHFRVNQ